jgi:hypothetical protein
VSSSLSRRTSFSLAITALFFALALAGILRHEMWRDEIEIWLLATESSSFGELLRNARTQPHPLLWYVLSWLLARATAEPLAIQLLSLAVGTVTVWLVVRHAPFGTLHKVLFCFGYFPLYEYTILSRSYGLDLLLSVLFCALYASPRRSHPALALVLALLANVHLLGAVVAGLLLLVLAWDARIARERSPLVLASLAAAAAAVLGGAGRVALGVARMGPDHVQRAPFDLDWLASTFSSIYYAYVPVPNVFERSFWNTNLLEVLPESVHRAIAVVLSLALLVLCARSLRRSRPLLGVYALGTLALLAIFAEKSSAYLRHQGHHAILFLALLWLDQVRRAPAETGAASAAALVEASPPDDRSAQGSLPRQRSPIFSLRHALTALLVLHVASGAFAYGVDLVHPFSNSLAAAHYIANDSTLADTVLVGSIDYTAQPVGAYLRRNVFYPDQRAFGTFIDWGPQRHVVRYKQVLEDAGELARRGGKPALLILDYDPRLLDGDRKRCRAGSELEVEIELLASFRCAIVSDENYWLVLLRSAGPPAGGELDPGELVAGGTPRCVSPRAPVVGPMVEIPEIQASEAARRERRRLGRLVREGATLRLDDGEDRMRDGETSPLPRAGVRRRGAAERAARSAAPADLPTALRKRSWKIAACDDDAR